MEPKTPAESEVRQGSAVQSLWGVLLAPEKTFQALAARPVWLPALLLLVASALALSILITPRLDMKQVIREAIEESGQEVPAAQIDLQVEMADKFKWVGTASQVILQPGALLLMAGVFLVLLRLAGSEIDFRRSLAVSVHGLLPQALATVLAIPVVLSRSELSMQDLRSATFLRSNLAAFAPESTGKAMLSLLSSVDLFSLWTIALLAIGFRVVGRVSKAAAWGVVLTLWVLMVGGKLALAAIF